MNIVADQYGALTCARNIADASAHVIYTAHKEINVGEFISGLYHLSASEKTTWHCLASAIMDKAKHFL